MGQAQTVQSDAALLEMMTEVRAASIEPPNGPDTGESGGDELIAIIPRRCRSGS
jgi:hypothetical protein